NQSTNSPVNYYTLACWFIIVTIWLIAFYSFFTDDTSRRMNKRMRLYGVMELQQLLAKMISTLILTMLAGGVSILVMQHLLDITLYLEDYRRIGVIMLLYSVTFLEGMAIIETIIRSQKLRLLIQAVFTAAVLLLGGTMVP